MPEDLFSVYEWLPDGTYQSVGEGLNAEEAVKRAHISTRKPAVLLGIIKKVMITDAGDSCVFLWENGKGIVFPLEYTESNG